MSNQGNQTINRFRGTFHTWQGMTHNLSGWGKYFKRSPSCITAAIKTHGSATKAFEYMSTHASRAKRAGGKIKGTLQEAKAILAKANGPAILVGHNYRGGRQVAKGNIEIIIECETIHHPLVIDKKGFGVSAMVGYTEEILAGARKSPSNETGRSLVITKALEQGVIKCAETGRQAVAQLCQICCVPTNCGVARWDAIK